MTIRKQGECSLCKAPLYGDDYGAMGHDCKARVQPFHAWMAWHPTNNLRDRLSVYRDMDECTRFIGHLRASDTVPPIKSLWRIVKVEVSEVEE